MGRQSVRILRNMQSSRLRDAKPPAKKEPATIQLGRRGRDSVINPDLPYHAGYRLHSIRPRDRTKSFAMQKITLKELYNQPVSTVLKRLIESSDAMSRVVRIKTNYLVKKWSIESPEDDDAALDIIYDFIERHERGGKSFIGTLKQIGYGMEVEGAYCSELVFDNSGEEAIKINYVSPFSLSFEQRRDENIGEYYIIGQKIAGQRELTVLQDEANPSDTFIYDPVFQLGDDPFGTSELAPACFGVAALSDLVSTIVDFIQGRVFPKHIYQVDVNALETYQYTKEELEEAANVATQLLEGKITASDVTQDVVLSTPIIATLVGAMERANIDGIEVLIDSFQTMIERGSGVPRVLFGGRRARGGLNDNESDIELIDFHDTEVIKQEQLAGNVSRHFTTILRHEGNTNHVNLLLESGNTTIKRIEAEAFNTRMDGFTKLKGLAVLSDEQFQAKVLSDSYDLSDLIGQEADMSEIRQVQPQPQQVNNE